MKTKPQPNRPDPSHRTRTRTRASRAGRVRVTCSYCHDHLPEAERRFCATCLAAHHADCWLEHGTCSAPGCGETRVLRPEAPDAPRRERRPSKPGKPGKAGKAKQRPGQRRRRRSGEPSQAQVEGKATTALILGLVSVLACGLASPFAITQANEATRLARRARLPVPAGATIGLVCGWIGAVGLGIAALAFMVQLGLFVVL